MPIIIFFAFIADDDVIWTKRIESNNYMLLWQFYMKILIGAQWSCMPALLFVWRLSISLCLPWPRLCLILICMNSSQSQWNKRKNYNSSRIPFDGAFQLQFGLAEYVSPLKRERHGRVKVSGYHCRMAYKVRWLPFPLLLFLFIFFVAFVSASAMSSVTPSHTLYRRQCVTLNYDYPIECSQPYIILRFVKVSVSHNIFTRLN